MICRIMKLSEDGKSLLEVFSSVKGSGDSFCLLRNVAFKVNGVFFLRIVLIYQETMKIKNKMK